jgi:hypothetical protein
MNMHNKLLTVKFDAFAYNAVFYIIFYGTRVCFNDDKWQELTTTATIPAS